MKYFLFLLLFVAHVFSSSDIAVISLASGDQYKKITRKAIENKRRYCRMHGYDFICGETVLDPSRPIPWTKVLLILKVLENPKYKWIFWSDADSLFMNLGVKLEKFIDPKYDFIISRETSYVNSGQFFLKNCQWSRDFLMDVYAHRECINHPWWEQQAIILELKNPTVRSHTKLLPQRAINSYARKIDSKQQAYRRGDFILHFAGTKDLKTLKSLIKRYSKQVINNPKKNKF